MPELPHTHSCFVCGDSNPHGLRLRFHTDGARVTARFKPCEHHIGFKGVVHGGVIATVLDEIMVWSCAVSAERFAFCAELNVRFLNPLSPGEEVLVSSELVANRRNRIFEVRADARTMAGKILVEATGKYIPIQSEQLQPMLGELVGGDAEWAKRVKI
jgi:acyl-coenzyme A thioesterase PaaI-like protein